MRIITKLLCCVFVLITFSACETYDIALNGIPKFVNQDVVELAKVKRISKFRSSVGHSYTDNYEKCRSMKHYYSLVNISGLTPGDSSLVFSPVNGSVIKIFDENSQNGVQFWIRPNDNKAFTIAVFHVVTSKKINVGSELKAGDILGKTASTDIAVMVNQFLGYKNISYFEIMTDDLFKTYLNRGINSVSEMIITKEQRDAKPCQCDGETFINSEFQEDWKVLN